MKTTMVCKTRPRTAIISTPDLMVTVHEESAKDALHRARNLLWFATEEGAYDGWDLKEAK